MAVKSWLVARTRSTSNSQISVFKEIDGQVVQIGSDFDTREDTSSQIPIKNNRVIHWQNDLYINHGSGIWKYDVANSGSWGHLLTLPGSDSADNMGGTGPHSVNVSGIPYLCCAYKDVADNNDVRISIFDENGSIIRTRPFTVAAGQPLATNIHSAFHSSLIFRNQLAWLTDNHIFIYNVDSDSLINIDTGASANFIQGDLDIFKDELYYMGPVSGGGGTFAIWIVDGSTIVGLIGSIFGSGETVDTPNKSLLFNDGQFMYAIAGVDRGVASDGWSCNQIEPTTLWNTDLDTVVFPSEFQDGGSFNATDNPDAQWYCQIDNETTPGTPEIRILFAEDVVEGTSFKVYDWQGSGNAMTSRQGGMDIFSFAIPHDKSGGGHRIWSGSGELNVGHPLMSVNGSNIDIISSLYGSSQTGVNIEWYFTSQGEPDDYSRCTLLTSTSGVVAGDAVTQLIADGVGQFTTKWAASIDGVALGDNITVVGRAFI